MQARFRVNEKVSAFLDDVYMTCALEKGVGRRRSQETRYPCLGVFATDVEDPRQEFLPSHYIVAFPTRWCGTC